MIVTPGRDARRCDFVEDASHVRQRTSNCWPEGSLERSSSRESTTALPCLPVARATRNRVEEGISREGIKMRETGLFELDVRVGVGNSGQMELELKETTAAHL